MATRADIMEYLLERLQSVGEVTAKKMFGEYGVYAGNKMFALVCDNMLFLKPTEAGKAFLGEPELAKPYPGAKDWYLIPEDDWDDSAWLCELVRTTLPFVNPVVKKPKKTAK